MKLRSPHKSAPGAVRIWRALVYSVRGLKAAYRHESAFRQELLLAAVLLPAAVLLEVGLTAKAFLIASVLLVLVVELLNSAIEAAVDRISLDEHELAKRAKDLGSAAVFLSLLNCAVVWGLVLLDAYR